ncbi:MAG TPA: hypothetical protein VGS21_02225 [Acidimicrobiales bacterium]|nr:hypothetical protein [Acidimicrobiales bacterium]
MTGERVEPVSASPRRGRLGRRFSALAAGAVAVAGWGFGQVAATSSPAPALASVLVPLPSNASSYLDAQLSSPTCPAVGDCYAVGSYSDTFAGYNGVGMVASLKNGSWSSTEALVPSNAWQPPISSSLNDISCAGTTYCVAVGWYDVSVSSGRAPAGLLNVLSGGAWTASSAPVPANASSGSPSTVLSAVKCSAPRECVAVGSYTDDAGSQQPLIDVERNGTWEARQGALPAGASASGAALDQVSCASTTDCVAIGTYLGPTTGVTVVFADSLSGTAWSSDALPPSGGGQPGTLSCSGPVFCVVPVALEQKLFLDVRSVSGWTSTAAPLPSYSSAWVGEASCASPAACTVVGTYQPSTGLQQAYVLTLANGAWHYSAPPAPPHAEDGLSLVSCPVSTDCTALGASFQSVSGLGNLLVDQEISGAWFLGSFVPYSSISQSTSGANGLTCPTDRYCIAVGSFDEPSSGYESIFVAATPRLSLTPASAAPGGTVTASLTGFAHGESVSLDWKTVGGTILGHVVTNNSGTGTGTFVVPAGKAGTYRVYALGARGERASATLKVS